MYKQGQIIAINGALYEYGGYNEKCDAHTVWGIDIDDKGHLTHTMIGYYFATNELKNKESFTQAQWCGIVEHFLRQDYAFSDEDVENIVNDIVGRCFAYGIPKVEDLPQYIAAYLDR